MVKRLFSTSIGSQFRRNFLKVARANMIALALPLAATPLMTRLFTPDDYGALAIFSSLLALLLAFCTWRFDWVIPNARTNSMAASLFIAGALILLLTVCLIAALLPLVVASISDATYVGQLGMLLFLLPVALIGSGLRQMLAGWFVRQGDLSAVSRATIAQSTANLIVGIGAGLLRLNAFGLIFAFVVAAWAGIGAMFHHAGNHLASSLRMVTRQSIAIAVRRHGRNASWSTLVAVANAISLSAPVLVLAYYYLPREVGWYALMYRLVAAPTGALSSALGQSFWSQAAEYARTRKIAELGLLYRNTTMRLGLACIPVILVCLAGPLYVGPILGSAEWEGAGYVLMAMTPLFIGIIMFSPTNHLVVLNMQHMQLLVDTIRLVLVVASIGIASYMELDFITAVLMASISSLIGHLTLFFLHLRMHARQQHEQR